MCSIARVSIHNDIIYYLLFSYHNFGLVRSMTMSVEALNEIREHRKKPELRWMMVMRG